MTAMLPAHLTETINSLGDAARTLAEESRADRDARQIEAAEARAEARQAARRQTALLVVIGVLVALVAILSVYSRIASNQARSIIQTINSCTNTEGECAKRGQQQTAAAIARLIAMQVEIEACGRDQQSTDAQYRACVNAALARVNAPPPSASPVTPAPTP